MQCYILFTYGKLACKQNVLFAPGILHICTSVLSHTLVRLNTHTEAPVVPQYKCLLDKANDRNVYSFIDFGSIQAYSLFSYK